MNAAEVREQLELHWKPSEYLVLHECAQDAMRQGRKIDTLVVSLWKSRGYELDAIEIKVSHSDWMRELNEPAKADWWWKHSHRFWVAVPSAIADKVLATLPTGWGLLAIATDGGCMAVRKPTKHEAEPLPWPAIVGIMRAASGAGANALVRARDAGEQSGYLRGKRDTERQTGDLALKAKIEELNALIAAFAETSGIDITAGYGRESTRRLGELVAIIRTALIDPAIAAGELLRASERLHAHARGIDDVARHLFPVAEEATS